MKKETTKLAITGCIGSGKSVVSRMMNVLGVPVYDCDVNAKQTGQKTVAEFAKVIGQDEKLKQLLKE